jgi:type VI secretion system protein ImpK
VDPRTVHDPFAERDEPTRTFLKPEPRGRGSAQPPGGPAPMRTLDQTGIDAQTAAQAAEHVVPDTGLNPLVALANRLLLLVPQLRSTRHIADPAALRASLAQGIRDFQTQAAAQGIAPERVMAARYVICTMIDEAAADTPWGGSGTWGRHSLLAMFHNETEGGEKVFQLMARLAERPDVNRDLLELIYAALVLGFEGRYRVVENGRAQLEAVRDKLATILKQQRGDVPSALADHWRGQPVTRRAAWSWLPIAGAAALTAIVLVGAYLAFSISLGNRSDPVFAEIQSIRLPPPVVAPPQQRRSRGSPSSCSRTSRRASSPCATRSTAPW